MSVIYLYGFVPESARLPDGGLLGVGDAVVQRVDGPGVAAVVSAVDPGEFEGEALERNCADVEWMASQGLNHEQVIGWFVDHATILPARFLTLFSSHDAVRAAMDREGDRIRSELLRFANLREWDLRVGHDPERLLAHLGEVSEEVGRLDREIEEASPGKRFLLEKRRKDMARTEGRHAARRLAGELLEFLRPHARDVVTLRPPTDTEPATLNAALLVDRDTEEALLAAVEGERARLEPLGLRVQLSGPWAPYRFLEEHA